MTYRWKNGWPSSVSRKVDAEVAGAEIAEIEQEHGSCTAPLLVDKSRPESAPLHPAFEWDDWRAAELFRQQQARDVIQHIVVVKDEDTERERTEPAFVHVVVEKAQGYVSTPRALSDEEMKAYVLEQAMKELQAVRRKYSELRELASVFAAIEQVEVDLYRREDKAGALAVLSGADKGLS